MAMAEAAVRAALLDCLREDAALAAQVNRVHDEPPVKASPPMVIVGGCDGSDWGTKDRPGREVRLSVTIEDDRETSTRISGIIPLVDAAVQGLPGRLAGWEAGSLMLLRSRLLRTGRGRWNALLDYRLRVLAR